MFYGNRFWFSMTVGAMCWVGSVALAQQRLDLTSPDGKIQVILQFREKLEPYPQGRRLYYSVLMDGKPVLQEGALGLEVLNRPPLAYEWVIKDKEEVAVDQTWERVWGKSKQVRDYYRQLTLTLEENQGLHRRIGLVFRAYNDGVAFRYVLPKHKWLKDFQITSEATWFCFTENHTLWAPDYGGFVSPQESEFQQMALNELEPGVVYGLPTLIKVRDDAWAAITEANLNDWAGLYLMPMPNMPHTLVSRLSPREDDPLVCVDSVTPRQSPWRVILLGRSAGALIESNLIHNLSEPCVLKETDWIKPGKCAWDWWWCGSYAPEVDFKLGPNQETMKYFIDFAAEMGWEYQLVDWQWYGPPFDEDVSWAPHPTSDITTCNPNIDVPALVKYASEKGVRLFVWLHWNHADKQMNKAFPLYEKWGVAGVKIDFMDHDSQEKVGFYRRTVELAAKHHLLVDFHGAYKPAGLCRTYPNLLTREGVMGNEYNKWSDRVTLDHCLTLPFTRMLAGPMDFTPGGFRHGNQESFEVVGGDSSAPMVYGRRGFQLAMMVVYESPLQVLCDSPYVYRKSSHGLDFLRLVPTTWDETRVLKGEVGDCIVIARRNGTRWYLGAMTDWTARTFELSLDFLGPGSFQVTVWHDSSSKRLDDLKVFSKEVEAGDTMPLSLVSGGGVVACFEPK